MTQVEIAKRILKQGNCREIACSGDKCEFLMEYSNNCRMQMGNTSEIDMDKVKQWLKEQEKEMLNLELNQIVEPPVKCWVRQGSGFAWIERWLKAVIDGVFLCYDGTDHKRTPDDKVFSTWEQCSLTDPTKKFKHWLKIEDVPVELWSRNLYKHKGEPISSGDILCPYKISDDEGNLLDDLVYLPLGQPLTGEWLEMGEWV